MTRRDLFTAALVVALILAAVGSVGLGLAQEAPKPQDDPGATEGVVPEGVEPAALLGTSIPVQGRLTNASGTPLNGTYSVTFKVYTVASGGTAVCTDGPKDITVSSGLFSDYVAGCSTSIFNGQQLYLGVKVGSDAEMTPRLPVYAVPYAMSVRPGADVVGAVPGLSALLVQNTAGGNGGPAIYAQGAGKTAGQATLRVYNTQTDHGMAGYLQNNSDYATTHFRNAGSGEVLYLESDGGKIIRGIQSDPWSEVFTVAGNGDVSQVRTADGLAKAGVVTICGGASSPIRWFNNVASTITVTGTGSGSCTIDFGFRVNDRFWSVTVSDVTGNRSANCHAGGGADQNKLFCARWNDDSGTGNSGQVMVLVY